jgi:hypothetical protein
MKSIIKLTQFSWEGLELPILVGTESIIKAEGFVLKHYDGKRSAVVTKIQSRGAMVETIYVTESVDEIYELYNQ